MTKQFSMNTTVGIIIVAIFITPIFALACSHSVAVTSPSAFKDLNTAFARFSR